MRLKHKNLSTIKIKDYIEINKIQRSDYKEELKDTKILAILTRRSEEKIGKLKMRDFNKLKYRASLVLSDAGNPKLKTKRIINGRIYGAFLNAELFTSKQIDRLKEIELLSQVDPNYFATHLHEIGAIYWGRSSWFGNPVYLSWNYEDRANDLYHSGTIGDVLSVCSYHSILHKTVMPIVLEDTLKKLEDSVNKIIEASETLERLEKQTNG